jgi:hypothetical protein
MGDGYKRFFWWLCLVTATVFVVYEVAVGHWLLALVAAILMAPTLATGGLGWQHPPEERR